MYEQFYRLRRSPFHITPDPEFLYLSPTHKEALASIVYGVEKRKGFVVVLGEVGLGKTTIVRSYLERADKTHLRVIYVFNPNVLFSTLLDTIDQAAGLDVRPEDDAARVQRLHDVLVEEYRQGNNVVLVVDEAQNMPIQTLENLRMLSNLETSKDKLIQIVLVGQPEFAKILDRHELRQLKQRVAVRTTLAPLTPAESLAYIRFRLEKAGAASTNIFTREALRRVVAHAKGIPRIINILCDNALITGLGYEKRPVTAAIVGEVIADFEGKSGSRLWKWEAAALAALLVVGALFFMAPPIYQAPRGPEPRGAPPPSLPAPIAQAPASAPSPPTPPATSNPPDAHGTAQAAQAAQAAVAPAQTASAEAKPAARQNRTVVTRVVKPGDNLYQLAAEVYGVTSKRVLDAIVQNNPEISDPDLLPVGMRIRFPEVGK